MHELPESRRVHQQVSTWKNSSFRASMAGRHLQITPAASVWITQNRAFFESTQQAHPLLGEKEICPNNLNLCPKTYPVGLPENWPELDSWSSRHSPVIQPIRRPGPRLVLRAGGKGWCFQKQKRLEKVASHMAHGKASSDFASVGAVVISSGTRSSVNRRSDRLLSTRRFEVLLESARRPPSFQRRDGRFARYLPWNRLC